MAIYQDLVSDHGVAGGYASVMRFVRKLRAKQPPDAHVSAPITFQVLLGRVRRRTSTGWAAEL